ncbi:hypothetical protein C7974DRAFT_404105, partial [Boeremia exigua]|uniref:uncharacterized protein n=1 Tax=Boeremia exigua TaxID=749465 RepID=UPI001E8CAAD4
MDDASLSGLSPIARMANASKKPAGWRLINMTRSTTRPRPAPQNLGPYKETISVWSTVQDDFEQRLSRFGIKVSEATPDNPPSEIDSKPTVHAVRGACEIMDNSTRVTAPHVFNPTMSTNEDFPPLETSTLAPFTNSTGESRLEDVERELRQAQSEVQFWKQKCEARELDLQAAYSETMKWRMEYEDLYGAIIRDQQIQPRDTLMKRHGTKSL